MPRHGQVTNPKAPKSNLLHGEVKPDVVWTVKAPAQLEQLRAAQLGAANPPAEPAKPAVNRNKLAAYVDERETSEGPGIRIRETFAGKPVPKGYQRHAMQELIDTTFALKERFAGRVGAVGNHFTQRAFIEAEQALSPHLYGRLGDVIPYLGFAEEEPIWLVRVSALPASLKTCRLADLPTREARLHARDNVEAIVRAAVRTSEEKWKVVHDGSQSAAPTLNEHPSNFLFDENGKVLQWNNAVVPSGPEHFKATASGDGVEFRFR